jgi:hypothetical protein
MLDRGVRLGLKVTTGVSIPRLSAAITTPSLNFTPSTDVPVTAGD